MPKVELDAIEETNRTGYPAPFDVDVAGRWYRRLARATGIEHFGASLVRLEPGAWSSQRHWHEGEAVLVEEDVRTLLGPGDVAAWAKGVANGHHLINQSDAPCRFLVVGTDNGKDCHYPDIDLLFEGATGRYVHDDRTPY